MIIRIVIYIFLVFFFSYKVFSRGIGETEITTEDGIEVFQNEKYYVLKKNVKIISDDFEITADNVKANFEKDLYDIHNIQTNGNSVLNAKKYGLYGEGDEIIINLKLEEIKIKGINSYINLEDVEMFSDGLVSINNLLGNFDLNGKNSNLKAEDLNIFGKKIEGIFFEIDGKKQISKLNVEDNDLLTIKTGEIVMNSKKAIYDDNTGIIELFSNVKIVKGLEVIYGDYGFFDTNKNSYKVKSNKSSKVKVIISNSNE
tara:strand:+ start:5088 stop:5858 length:771 start_codon:yes stop_codon:yes gene_type:complete